ncbi:MAG: MlaD family protein, partial [Actinomycetota bacterium]
AHGGGLNDAERAERQRHDTEDAMSASKEFRVGIFVIVSASLVLGGVIAIGSGSIFKDTEIIETSTTESVNGLQIGSPVKYRGVPIGEDCYCWSIAVTPQKQLLRQAR